MNYMFMFLLYLVYRGLYEHNLSLLKLYILY